MLFSDAEVLIQEKENVNLTYKYSVLQMSNLRPQWNKTGRESAVISVRSSNHTHTERGREVERGAVEGDP